MKPEQNEKVGKKKLFPKYITYVLSLIPSARLLDVKSITGTSSHMLLLTWRLPRTLHIGEVGSGTSIAQGHYCCCDVEVKRSWSSTTIYKH